MDILANLALGFSVALSPDALFICLVGVTLGTLIGILPGIGPIAGISLLLPLTFHLGPTEAIIMLAGMYYGAQYGGSTASILLNLPGTASSSVTCLDGYPMSRNGRGGAALFLTTISSFVGGTFAILLMVVFSPTLARLALQFGSTEYAAMMVLGLLAAATLSTSGPIKGVAMVALGLLIGLIGADPETGLPRFTFGQLNLLDGINIVIVAMGLFGVSEVLVNLMRPEVRITDPKAYSMGAMMPTREEARRSIMPTGRGSLIGAFVGLLPGAGAILASFMAYAFERRVSKTPEKFGTGMVEGVTSVEAANNSAAQAAFIPTMTLGIPGSSVMALMLGALMIHGITPGPMVIVNQPELFWGLIASFFIGNVMLLILNLPMIGLWLKILMVPRAYLFPGILFFVCMGTYGLRNSPFDVGLVMLFGLLGYGLRYLHYPLAPLILGFILGPLLEEHVRRAMLLSGGDATVFVTRPLSGTIFAICIGLLAYAIFSEIRRTRATRPKREIGSGT
jgi:TctA family transporter